MERRYKVDPLTTPLARGERPLTWGLNVSALRLKPEELRAPYERMRAQASQVLRRAGAYVYPFEHLHITASSPAPFTHTTMADPSQRAEFERVFLTALREECVPGRDGFPAEPFPLVFEAPRLDPSAGLFVVGDPTGALPRIRAALARCYARPELAPFLPSSVPRTPGIVHTTFVRFADPPEEGLSDDDIARLFEESVVKVWEPVTVLADALYLVREIRAYMHLSEEDLVGQGSVLHAIPYTAAEKGEGEGEGGTRTA